MTLQDQIEVKKVAIGENLKRLRRDKQWTQGELSETSGIKVGQISKIELNKTEPKLETIYKIINALECSPNALLNDVADMNLDGRMAMALERAQSLPDKEKNNILDVIDKYCIAVSMQGLMDNNSKTLMGFWKTTGKTEDLADN